MKINFSQSSTLSGRFGWKIFLNALCFLFLVLGGYGNADQKKEIIDFGDKRPIPKVGQKWTKKTISNGKEETNFFEVIEVSPSFYKMEAIFNSGGMTSIGKISYIVKDEKCFIIQSSSTSILHNKLNSEKKFNSNVNPCLRCYVSVNEMPFTEEYEEIKSVSGRFKFLDRKIIEYRRVTYNSLGQEKISIPAGSFIADKIRITTELKNKDGSFSLYETETVWRNDKVGRLKVHIINHMRNGNEIIHERIKHEGFNP